HMTLGTVARQLLNHYPRRTTLGIVLMTTQSFMYNAISFTYPFVLTKFYDVPSSSIGLYILPFALGNFLGPLVLGRYFDTIGRKPMISFTYAVSGCLLAVKGCMFWQGMLTSMNQKLDRSCVFYFSLACTW